MLDFSTSSFGLGLFLGLLVEHQATYGVLQSWKKPVFLNPLERVLILGLCLLGVLKKPIEYLIYLIETLGSFFHMIKPQAQVVVVLIQVDSKVFPRVAYPVVLENQIQQIIQTKDGLTSVAGIVVPLFRWNLVVPPLYASCHLNNFEQPFIHSNVGYDILQIPSLLRIIMPENFLLYLLSLIIFLTLLVGFYLIIRAVKSSNVIIPEEPDYIERFKELAPGALLEVIEQRKATVEEAVLEDLPLDEIKQQNADIIAKFEELDGLTEQFREDNDATRQTTRNLKMALSGNIADRGNWGEASFESILNMSGLVEDVTYHPELVLTKSSKPLSRPDFTVMLADGSAIAIDSKALLGPLVSLYDQAMEIPSEKDRNAAFSSIADNIWGAIMDKKEGIKQREYPKMLEEHFGVQGPSFTLVFIPGDHILAMAYKNDKGRNTHGRVKVPLQEAAYLNGVLLATPTMVMALLTMIRDEWAAYKIDEDTQKIQDLAVELYERHVKFGDRLAGVGDGLKKATEKYNEAVTAYQGPQSIRKTGENMIKAGIKDKAGNKELPAPSDSTGWKTPPAVDTSKFESIPVEEEE